VTVHPLTDRMDWERAGDDALALFTRLLRMDTVNAPDRRVNEMPVAELLAERLRGVGLEPEVLWGAPGRGNVVCRLPGDGSGGAPILLSGHLDVVPADRSTWSRDPFAGEVHDGWLYGRGTIDMKNMVAMSVVVMELLARSGAKLRRDLVFAGVADEEAGCEHGSLWLAKNHPDKVRGEYAISEIGGFTLHSGGKKFYPVQVAEKGICWVTITAKGTPGHGSLPNKDNPIPKLARAAARLGEKRLPVHVTPVVERQIRTLAANQKFPNSFVLRGLLSPTLCDPLLDHVFPDPSLASSFDAALHNTANPTMLRAGEKVNQVPAEASLQVDGRLLPGQSADDFVREVRAVIGDGYHIHVDRVMPATEGVLDDPLADRIEATLKRHDPDGIMVRTMIPGFTDAKAWSQLGMKCWGFSPVQLPPGVAFSAMFHGNDERIPVAGFRWGLRVLFDFVADLVAPH
jgi:acetylornithine deacetylase/succinyl-diaminopimelate desuccinylase-like protein